MGLFDSWRRRPRADIDRNPADDRWFGPQMVRNVAAGVPVSVARALTVPSVVAAVNVLSETTGALPWAVFRWMPNGDKEKQDNNPIAALLQAPNPETTDVEFFSQLAFDLATEGNHFSEIRAGRLGPVSELWRLDPNDVTVQRLVDGSKRYTIAGQNGVSKTLGDHQVWHLKTLPYHDGNLRGTGRIYLGRETIGAAIALQDYAARFFANDATPPVVIEHPSNFKDDKSRDNYIKAIKSWWGGKNRHSPGVLEYGAKMVKIGATNEEAQFLETRKELDNAIARLWRIPPHKIGLLDKATNNNIEHQALEFVTDTMLPLLRLIERSISSNIIVRSDTFFFEFNVAGLLRGDLQSRYAAYAQARQWGWLNVDDIRRLENMNGIENGDIYLQPMNMVEAGSPPPAAAPAAEPKAKKPGRAALYGPSGDVVSEFIDGRVVRLEDYRMKESRNAA
jgi:HK97 family phage portal protein